MQIQPLEKLHSCLITSVAFVVVATERLPRARVELSFAQTRGIFEVFRRKKADFFSCFAKVAFLGSSEVADPVSANCPSALFRAALPRVQHSFCVEDAPPGMAGGFDGNPGTCNPISHLCSELMTSKTFTPASRRPQPMTVATCCM